MILKDWREKIIILAENETRRGETRRGETRRGVTRRGEKPRGAAGFCRSRFLKAVKLRW